MKPKFTGGVDCGTGWRGDIKNMLLYISKIKTLEWKPKYNTKQTIKSNQTRNNRIPLKISKEI